MVCNAWRRRRRRRGSTEALLSASDLGSGGRVRLVVTQRRLRLVERPQTAVSRAPLGWADLARSRAEDRRKTRSNANQSWACEPRLALRPCDTSRPVGGSTLSTAAVQQFACLLASFLLAPLTKAQDTQQQVVQFRYKAGLLSCSVCRARLHVRRGVPCRKAGRSVAPFTGQPAFPAPGSQPSSSWPQHSRACQQPAACAGAPPAPTEGMWGGATVSLPAHVWLASQHTRPGNAYMLRHRCRGQLNRVRTGSTPWQRAPAAAARPAALGTGTPALQSGRHPLPPVSQHTPS